MRGDREVRDRKGARERRQVERGDKEGYRGRGQ